MNLENLEVIEALTADELQQQGGNTKEAEGEAIQMAQAAYKKCIKEIVLFYGQAETIAEGKAQKKACKEKVNNELGHLVKAGKFW